MAGTLVFLKCIIYFLLYMEVSLSEKPLTEGEILNMESTLSDIENVNKTMELNEKEAQERNQMKLDVQAEIQRLQLEQTGGGRRAPKKSPKRSPRKMAPKKSPKKSPRKKTR